MCYGILEGGRVRQNEKGRVPHSRDCPFWLWLYGRAYRISSMVVPSDVLLVLEGGGGGCPCVDPVVLWALVRVTGQARVRTHSRRSYRGRATANTVMEGVLLFARLVAGCL